MEKGKSGLKDINGNLEDILETKKRAFVLFYASGCPFCQAFLPIYNKYCENQPETFLCVMVDDKEELMDRYSVEIVPTVILFDNGRIKRRYDGEAGIGLNEKRLKELIDQSNE